MKKKKRMNNRAQSVGASSRQEQTLSWLPDGFWCPFSKDQFSSELCKMNIPISLFIRFYMGLVQLVLVIHALVVNILYQRMTHPIASGFFLWDELRLWNLYPWTLSCAILCVVLWRRGKGHCKSMFSFPERPLLSCEDAFLSTSRMTMAPSIEHRGSEAWKWSRYCAENDENLLLRVTVQDLFTMQSELSMATKKMLFVYQTNKTHICSSVCNNYLVLLDRGFSYRLILHSLPLDFTYDIEVRSLCR